MILTGPFSFDLTFTQMVQSFQPAWLTWLAKTVSDVTEPVLIVPSFVVAAVILYIKRQSIRELTLLLIMSGNWLTVILKNFFQRPRPMPELVHVLVHETGFSFPSGHAVAAVLAAGAIWLVLEQRRKSWLNSILVLYVLAVGWSRIYLGVHWASDVVAGFLVGGAWLLLVLTIASRNKVSTTAPDLKHPQH